MMKMEVIQSLHETYPFEQLFERYWWINAVWRSLDFGVGQCMAEVCLRKHEDISSMDSSWD
jgi:hypothetical protein